MGQYEPGAELVAKHPHPIFEQIARQGYELWFWLRPCDEDSTDRDLDVEMRHAGVGVAWANFSEDRRWADPQNVKVALDHQRRKLATAMYLFAEIAFDRPLRNIWEGVETGQSEAAKMMWESPDRPFGRGRWWDKSG